MRKLGLIAILLGAACSKAPGPAPASHDTPAAIAAAPIAELTVDQVDHLLADRACTPVDANGDPLRRQLGTLPGAVLLGDIDAPLTNLPPDKATQLVFYCANTSCGALHLAADKARTAGYTRVAVMPDGIAGWVKAGKTTSKI